MRKQLQPSLVRYLTQDLKTKHVLVREMFHVSDAFLTKFVVKHEHVNFLPNQSTTQVWSDSIQESLQFQVGRHSSAITLITMNLQQ